MPVTKQHAGRVMAAPARYDRYNIPDSKLKGLGLRVEPLRQDGGGHKALYVQAMAGGRGGCGPICAATPMDSRHDPLWMTGTNYRMRCSDHSCHGPELDMDERGQRSALRSPGPQGCAASTIPCLWQGGNRPFSLLVTASSCGGFSDLNISTRCSCCRPNAYGFLHLSAF